ncbi:casp carboxy-terminal protein [Cystoisospora suis]|uniref:Casp carboxy-terminal protein n=1 Tax=Cystoisospora suis TaxID=483139 RepID=A0A2C6KZH8_9APIC|nr:casp carboxy-terminal protein [Cystoisospora suis]
METTDFTLPTHQHMQGEEHLLILGGEQENKEKEKKREKDEEEKKNNDLIDFSFNMSSSPREDPSSSSSSSSPYLSSHIIRQRDAEDEREEGKEKEESLHLSSSSFSSNRGIDEGDIAKKYLQERTPRGREEIEEEEKRGLSQDLHNPSSPLQSVTYSSSAFSSSPPPLHDSQREEEREERESNGNLHPISSSAIVPPHVPPSSSATSSSVFVSVPNSSSSSSSSSPRLSSSLVTIEGSPPHTHGGEEARKRKEERRGREENEGKSLLDLSNSLVTSTESTSTSENAISPHISTSQTSSSSPPLPPTSSSPPPSSLPPLPSSSPPPPPSSPPSSSSPPPPPLPSSSSPLPPFNSQHPPFKVNDHSDTSFPTFPRRGEEEEKKRLAVTPSPTATTTTRATTLGFVDSPSATEVRSLPNGTMGTSQEKEREGEGGTRRREEEVAGREEGKEPGVHKKAEHHSVPSTSIATNSSSSPPSVGAKKTTYKKRGEAVESWIRVWKELSEKALFSLEIDQAKKNAVKARKKLAADTKEIRRLFAVVVGAACLQAGGKVSSHASDGSAMPDGSGVEGREKLKSATDTLLRDYQNEIDTLTRRAKTAEAQFLSLVQVLLQQPDLPGLLLGLQRDAAVEEEEEGEKRKRGGEYSEERKEDSISKTDQKKTSSETAIMVSRLQKELHALQCRYEHCETQRIEVTRIADLLKDEIRRFQEMEKEKDFFLSEANKEIDRLAREYEDNLVKKDKEIDQLKEQIEDLEKEFNGLTNQAVTLRKLEEEHVHLKQTFDSKLHLLIQQKEKELLQKSAMKDHEQERLSAFLKQRVDMLEEKNLFLEGKVAEGQQQLVKLKTESEKKCSALTAEINSLLLSAAGQQSMRSQAEAPSIGWKEGKGEGQGEGQEVSSTSSSSHPSLLPSPHLLSSQHTAAVHLRALEVAQERIAALQEEQRRLYRQLEDGRKLREKEAERRETDLRDQESRYNAQLKELQDALSQCPTHEQYANLQREISRLQEVCRSSSSQNKQLSGHPPEVYIHANEAMQQNLYRHADANPSSLHTPSSKEEGGEGSSSSSSSSQLFYLQEEIRQLQYRIDEQEKEMQERERKLQKELEEEKSRHEEEVISIVKRVKEEMRKTSLQKESAIVRKEEEEATMNGVTGEEKNKMGEQGDDQLGDRTILSSFRDRSSDEGYKSKEQEDSRQNASSFSSSSPSILDLVLAQRERYKAKISQLEEVCP